MAARAVPEGLRVFLATEVGGTSVLIAATLGGLVWANSPFADGYDTFWHTALSLGFGEHRFSLDLRHWVNDGLMALFFFVIGLEISREVKVGQLRDRRLVGVPVIAALGGMALPAGIYLAINAGGEGAGGWGIPLASDTAFVLGLLAVIGARCAEPLRAYLLTLAVVDDIGAILIVAIFYTADLSPVALLIAFALFGLVVAARWLRLWRAPAYVVLGFGIWVATLESGVHPTLVGIVLGALVTVYAPGDHQLLRAEELVNALAREPTAELAQAATRSVRESVSVNERLQLLLHPWTSYVIVPLFALANAGVRLDADTLRAAATSPVTLGIMAGLVFGKFAGICLGTWLPLRFDLGDLPGNLVWGQIFGGAAVSGIGFTVSLFITDLAFGDPALQNQAKIGIIAGSLISAGLGWLVFRAVWDRGAVCAPSEDPEEPAPYDGPLLDPPAGYDHVRGPDDAPVTLVEYGDYECPYCGKAQQVLAELAGRYGDRLRLVFRHFPLTDLHPRAIPAALLAEAASDAGRFWEMHDLLFENQRALNGSDLAGYARSFGVNPWPEAARYKKRIHADVESGRRSGVRGTPTFFVNGIRYEGRHDLKSMSAAIEAALIAVRPAGK